jgi:hypothetical protein
MPTQGPDSLVPTSRNDTDSNKYIFRFSQGISVTMDLGWTSRTARDALRLWITGLRHVLAGWTWLRPSSGRCWPGGPARWMPDAASHS